MLLLFGLAAYGAAGLLIAVLFVAIGAPRLLGQPVTLAGRLMLMPGAAVLWPFLVAPSVLRRWTMAP